MSSVKENLEKISALVSKNAAEPNQVKILAVTKFQPLEKVQEAIEAGISYLGVNYAQEGEKLRQQIGSPQVIWHFIGHIQSRKAKLLLPYHCIESVDRVEIVEELDKRASNNQKSVKILVEINIGREPQKSGIAPEQLDEFLSSIKKFKHIEVIGLMAMPPALVPEERRPFFKQMKNLFDQRTASFPFEILSMGTSEDYCIALQEGANLIRLGTALFGSRQH